MPMKRCVVRVDPQGKSMVVDILDTSGVSVTAYESSEFAAARLTLPMTITGQTDFCLPSPGPYDVSCKVGGTEVANAGAAKRVQAGDTPVRLVPDWERELAGAGSAASGPVDIGRPKLADGTTFDGIPEAISTGLAWITYPPLFSYAAGIPTGEVMMTVPIVFPAMHMTEAIVYVDSPALTVDTFDPLDADFHVAFVAVDADWRPTSVVFEKVATMLSTNVDGDEIAILDAPIDLPAGRYAVLYEAVTPVGAANSPTVKGQLIQTPGATICADVNGIMPLGFQADHTFGAFDGATPPEPAAVLPGDPGSLPTGNFPLWPLFFQWNPA